ncbi:MAG TPA: CBS domain-containing protein [Acidimicrobiales bacterium]|jgi:CBS domain-containing protein|nr:CBS domain-containing protein [Acidimicrobiales bacterium]
MRTIRDVMCEEVDVLRTTDTAADAASFLAGQSDDSVPLCQSDGSLAGVVSTRDIVTQVVAKGRDPREVPLAEFAGPAEVVALDVDVSLEDAVALMCRHRRSRLLVLKDECVVGFVTQRDVARSISFQPPWADS